MKPIYVIKPFIDESDVRAVTDAARNGWGGGARKYIKQFEEDFAKYIGTKYAVASMNGTAALHLALVALGIGKGDEVVVPSLTYISCANVVRYTGAEPSFVDSHPDYWCMDPEKLEESINKKTKAIMPVHVYGHPCDMDKIMKIAKEHDLYILEDCAESHGATYKGRMTGTFGDISCYSFFGNKVLTTGEGGMSNTNDEKLCEDMMKLRTHGVSSLTKSNYEFDRVGYNYRMTNFQAALGSSQLRKIGKVIAKRRKVAQMYKKHLKDNEKITLMPKMKWANPVYWLYTILVDHNENRNRVMEELKKNGIDSRPAFPSIPLQKPYINHKKYVDTYRIAYDIGRKGINLPSSYNLTDADVGRICNIIESVVN